MKRSLSLCFAIALSVISARAGVFDFIKKTVGDTNTGSTTSPSLAGFSQDQVADALKQALAKGVSTAITNLGQSGGFLNNPKVKIPMPEKLQAVLLKARRIVFPASPERYAQVAVPD